jgi:hypothetical protein
VLETEILGTPVRIERRGVLPQNYEFAPFTNFLNGHPPKLLAVATPKDNGWVYPLYLTFVVDKYPTYFLSGLIIDNQTYTPARWFGELKQAPDYLLATSSLDLMDVGAFATPVLTTPDITLYQVAPAPLEAWEKLETSLKEVDAKLEK